MSLDAYWKLTRMDSRRDKPCIFSVQPTYKTIKLKCITKQDGTKQDGNKQDGTKQGGGTKQRITVFFV